MNLLLWRRPPALAFERAEARIVCLAIIMLAALVAIGLQIATLINPAIAHSEKFGGDFPTFHRAARIVAAHPAQALYDEALNTRMHLEMRPQDGALRLPYVYPPFIAYLFRPLASLPYSCALAVWLIVAAALFSWSVTMLLKSSTALDGGTRHMALLLALSFEPFIYEVWLGGQLSVLAVVAVALAIRAEEIGRLFLSGLALSICCYKPTLLILVVPMLLLTRRWPTLAGLAAGTATILGVTLATLGVEPMLGFLDAARLHSERSIANPGFFKLIKFVDLNLFAYLVAGKYALWLRLALAPVAVWVLWRLARFWWTRGAQERNVAWALALAWGLLINIYVPVYDTVLLIPAMLLAGRAAWSDPRHRESFLLLLTVVYLTPWVSQFTARFLPVQLFTLALLLFGFWLLALSSETQNGPDAACVRAVV